MKNIHPWANVEKNCLKPSWQPLIHPWATSEKNAPNHPGKPLHPLPLIGNAHIWKQHISKNAHIWKQHISKRGFSYLLLSYLLVCYEMTKKIRIQKSARCQSKDCQLLVIEYVHCSPRLQQYSVTYFLGMPCICMPKITRASSISLTISSVLRY